MPSTLPEAYSDYLRTRVIPLKTGEEKMPLHHTGPKIPLEAGKFYRLRDMVNKIYCIGSWEDGVRMACTLNSSLKIYKADGDIDGTGPSKHAYDAVMEWRDLVRVQITGFENVYSDHTRTYHATKNEANSNVDASKTRIACITLEREVVEGEGLYD